MIAPSLHFSINWFSVVISFVLSAVIAGIKIILKENALTIFMLNRQITPRLKSAAVSQ